VIATAASEDALMAFLRSVELAMAQLYGELRHRLVSAPAGAAAEAFGAHHAAHAAALAPWSGAQPPTGPNQALLANVAPSVESVRTEQDALQFLGAMEEQLASTYQWAVGRLTSSGAIAASAVILPAECQHAVILGNLQGKPLAALVPPFEGTAQFLNPADFGAA
jgi:hypothetical protein